MRWAQVDNIERVDFETQSKKRRAEHDHDFNYVHLNLAVAKHICSYLSSRVDDDDLCPRQKARAR